MYPENYLGIVIPQVDIPKTAAPTVVKDGSKFQSITSSIANIFSSAAPIVQAVVPNKIPSANPALENLLNPGGGATAPPPPAPEKKSNTLMYLGIAAGVAALVGGGYLLTRKKKSKGLGDLTAKTAAGKRRQAAAIGARIAEEGRSKPKRARKKSRKAKKVRI